MMKDISFFAGSAQVLTPFKEWVLALPSVDGPQKDLITDIVRDPDFPEAMLWSDIETYLISQGACDEAITTAKVLFDLYAFVMAEDITSAPL